MSETWPRVKMAIATTLFTVAAAFKKAPEVDRMQAQKTAGKIYEFEMTTIDGKPRKLADYKGHPLLIVNVASLCGLTPQYDDLQKLHETYSAKGLRIAGFPANEFGKQEPGTDAEIKQFCRTKYSVGFDLYSKIVVKGPGIHPLYRYLTQDSGFPGEITWNFEKFLVGPDGMVKARFSPETSPTAKEVVSAIESLLK